MSLLSLLLVSSHVLAGPRPDALVDLTLSLPDAEPRDLVLRLERHWTDRGLAPVEHLQDPISTMLTPRVVRRPGTTTWWFEGHRLASHESPGDTVVTYVLLLETTTAGDAISGYWWEDHMEIPTRLMTARGNVTGGRLRLDLTDHDDADAHAEIAGTIRLPSPRP